MGTNISGGIIVGATFSEVESALRVPEVYGDDTYEYLEDSGFDSMPPSYDSDRDTWVVGYKIRDFNPYDESFEDWVDTVEMARDRFMHFTGLEAHIIGMQDVP
jgi:hypothetical protein